MLLSGLMFTTHLQAGALERLFSPKAELWAKWEQHDPESNNHIEHDNWHQFLQTHVKTGPDGVNRIEYARVSQDDKQLLSGYIKAMQGITITQHNRPQQLAYWVNLYNALTIKIVLDHYPVKSIRDIDISPGFFSDGPWGKKLIKIEGESLSLNDIEHRIIRPVWQDPRIHYVVNCASVGCPDIRKKALTADALEKTLDQASREFVNHPRGVNMKENDLYVSSIYSWFQEDFGKNEGDVIEHIRRYANPALKQQLKDIDSITDDNYDWSLNDLSIHLETDSTEE